MKNLLKTRTVLVLPILWLLTLAACSSSPTPSYYLLGPLDSMVAASETPEQTSESAKGPTIVLGPFEFPAYLDRSRIVRRRGVELELLDFHRWGEPLEDGFSTALAEGLARHSGVERVVVFPGSGTRRADLRVKGRVIRFDADASGTAVLTLRWWVQDGEGKVVVAERRSQFTQAATPGDVVSMVEALAATVDALAAEMAVEVAP